MRPFGSFLLASAMAVSAFAAESPGLQWTATSPSVRVADGYVTVDGNPGVAAAKLDLSPYLNDAIMVSVRGEARDVSAPPNIWNGVKVMLSYTERSTNRIYRQAMNGRMGTSGVETFHIYADFRGKGVKEATLSLGLESVTGYVRFDLSTLRIDKIDQCAYSKRVASMPQLKGFMLPHKRPPTEEDFATLEEWGAKLARFQMERAVVGEKRKCDLMDFDRWLEERMDWLDAALDLGRKHGIRLIVDMHSTPGGGSGASGNHRIFEPGPWAEHYLDAWRKIATRFRGRKGIYAFDLVNEPHNPSPRTEDCWNLQYKAAQIVRAIDPETPISIESEWGDLPKPFEWLCPLPMTNIIYQVHMYAPSRFTHQRVNAAHGKDAPLPYPGKVENGELWNKDYLRRQLQPVRDFQLRYGARILVGEFSAAVWADGADMWLKDVISIFNEYGWDWTYHAFREASCWSLEYEGTSWDDIHPSADNTRKRVVLDGLRAEGKGRR